jgi:hypothetical protein
MGTAKKSKREIKWTPQTTGSQSQRTRIFTFNMRLLEFGILPKCEISQTDAKFCLSLPTCFIPDLKKKIF